MFNTQVKESYLSTPSKPAGLYHSYRIVDDTLHVSGQTARINGSLVIHGRLGKDLTVDHGQQAANLCAINVMSQAQVACDGTQKRIKSVIKLCVYLQTTECFTQHAEVADGASKYLLGLLGQRGIHCRTSVGVASLPGGSPVEIDAIFELENNDV